MNLEVEVRNLEKVVNGLEQVRTELPNYVQSANQEISSEILSVQGLKSYPPATAANQPPVPYYIRGKGMQTAYGNTGKSERLGTQWQTVAYGTLGARIFNDVTYAKYVHGEEQASFMAPKGWKKLADVARQKLTKLASIYQRWINKLIKDKGL